MPNKIVAPRLRARCGFSLVELLAVLAIISVLLGMLLPATQRIREAARRTVCSNNLRQISIGLQNFHSAFNHFPVGVVEWRAHGDHSQRQLAWSVFLLPFIEQGNVHHQLDLETPFDSPQNAVAAAIIIDTYVCPSNARDENHSQGRAISDYGGIYGERISAPNDPPKGVMIHDRPIAFSDITDGTSQTLIVAEDSRSRDGQWINGRNVFDQAFPINQGPVFENDIRSEHPAGANGTFCDGSVRFLANDMELAVLAAICTRAGGEVESLDK